MSESHHRSGPAFRSLGPVREPAHHRSAPQGERTVTPDTAPRPAWLGPPPGGPDVPADTDPIQPWAGPPPGGQDVAPDARPAEIQAQPSPPPSGPDATPDARPAEIQAQPSPPPGGPDAPPGARPVQPWPGTLPGWPVVAPVTDPVGGRHLLVSGHAEVRQVLADPETFAPDNALDAVTPIPVAALRILTRHRFRLPPTLANNGGPSHPAVRAIVADALHPDRVAAQRPWLTGVVRRRVAGLAVRLREGHPVDLYAMLAADLPLLVLARLVALPAGDAGVVKEFSRAALELFWAPLDAARQRRLAEVVGRYHAVLREVAATAPGMVARLREYAGSLDTVVGALFFLLVAGQETTSQFLTLLLHRLATEPATLARLRAGTVGVDAVVEEGLRVVPPIVTWRRRVARDTELGGVAVPRGTSVVLWLARAGRDPAVVARPEEFAPGQRGSRRHLAFGAGAHRCVGAQLARMEAGVVVAEAAPLLWRTGVLRAPRCPENLSFRMPDALVVSRVDTPGRNGSAACPRSP